MVDHKLQIKYLPTLFFLYRSSPFKTAQIQSALKYKYNDLYYPHCTD